MEEIILKVPEGHHRHFPSTGWPIPLFLMVLMVIYRNEKDLLLLLLIPLALWLGAAFQSFWLFYLSKRNPEVNILLLSVSKASLDRCQPGETIYPVSLTEIWHDPVFVKATATIEVVP